jgi:phosphoribosylaminoimidazole-succinocarboxamide synthase
MMSNSRRVDPSRHGTFVYSQAPGSKRPYPSGESAAPLKPQSLCRGRQSARLNRGWSPALQSRLRFGSRGLNPYISTAPFGRVGVLKKKGRSMDFLKPRLLPMNRRRRIYEGKAKVLYEGPEPGTLIQHFKDDATAFNAKKHEVVEGKGVLNNRISEYLFQNLNDIGVPTHFIRRLNMREQLIREVEIIPLEVVVRNVAAGSLATRLGIEEGTQLPRSIIEFYYKNDALNDPIVSEEHITAFGWAAPQEIDDIMALAIRVNDFLTGLFLGVGIRLVDFKIECGRLWEGETMRIVVADEISPDSCRLWDAKSNDKMDKDRFRRDMGGMIEAYTEVARRLGVMQEGETARAGAPKLVK